MSAPATYLIALGGATVSLGPWVANNGATTMTDVGHTKAATELNVAYEDYPIESEQSFGPLRKSPISATVKVKIPMLHSDGENMRIALRQTSSQLSGSVGTQTLLVGVITEQYHRVTVQAKGVASSASTAFSTRLVTIYRGIVDGLDAIPYGKRAEQAFVVSLHCLYDDSMTTTDKFCKIVDS
jgi:hypothetical protein